MSLKNGASLIPFSQDVPNLSPENCVRMQGILCPLELQPFRKISQTIVRISTFIPLLTFVLVFLVDLHHLHEAVSSLRSDAGLEDEVDDESCFGDVEDELLPELEDNPRTTRGDEVVRFASNCPHLFGRMWFLTAEPHIVNNRGLRRVFPGDWTAGVSSSNCTVMNRFKS